MRLLILTTLCLLISLPATAQLYDEEGLIIPPEGAKGRYTEDQILPFALQLIPGELIEQRTYRDNDDIYHEYEIQTLDGSVFEIEYFAVDADLYAINVLKLSDNPVLPPGIIDEEAAKLIAEKHIQKETAGKLRVKVKKKNIEIGIYKNKLVYYVTGRKGAKTYKAAVEAFSGNVLDTDEQ